MQTDQKKEKSPLGVYIHIPFCVQKCGYCDFLSAPADEDTKREYCRALLQEIASYKEKVRDYRVQTIYFGGGTPSCLNSELLSDILEQIRQVFSLEKSGQVETTLEVNPGTVDTKKWKSYAQMGINRISMGLQSTHNAELQLLGRIHTYEEFLHCFQEARDHGFSNISVDLISALPGQTLEAYEESLQRVAGLQPEHISSYSLIVEEGTRFWDLYSEGKPFFHQLPEEELDRKMYEATKAILAHYGYERYEISNYAKPGFESRHNSSYWIRTPYIGLGLGASSFFENVRYSNVQSLEEYKKYACDENRRTLERQYIGKEEAMEEFMFLGLRRMKGVKKQDFLREFACPIEQIYGTQLERLQQQGLLLQSEDRIWLTDYGIDVSNQVFEQFLL